jgi:hypothetical protein
MIGLTGEISEVWQMKELEEGGLEGLWERGLARRGKLRREWWLTIKYYVSMKVSYKSR